MRRLPEVVASRRVSRLAAGLVTLAVSLTTASRADEAPVAGSASCTIEASTGDRLLVLALDGVPLRVVEAAREQGAFAGWGDPVGLISTFPSMTNVAFTAMLERWGADSISGYETRHFDLDENHLVSSGGPSGFAWKSLFTVIGDSFAAKRALYMTPEKRSRKVIALVEAALLDHAEPDVVLAHMASTDMLAHLRGDAAEMLSA